MKIIFLTKYVPPKIEGLGEYTCHLARHLKKLGADVLVVTSAGQVAEESWIKPIIKNWDLETISSSLSGLDPDWVCFQYSPPLYGKWGICPQFGNIFAALQKRFSCKVAVTFHEITVQPGNLRHWFLKFILDHQGKKLFQASRLAVGTCGRHFDILSSFHAQTPIKIIPVGTNIPVSEAPASDLENLRQRYGIRNKKVATFFGRVSGFRNFEIALQILKKANRSSVRLFLLLLGCVRSSNPSLFEEFMKNAAKQNIEKYTIETGDLTPREISHHLQLTDIFLFPQIDGVSTRNTTYMSALAHGLPVIAYEPIAGNYDGYELPYGSLVARGDENAFVEKTMEFISADKDREAACRQQKYFTETFSWDRIAMSYMDFLKNA